MTSDNGDYQLTGSLTGADGEGHVTRSFTSRSGQIQIDPGCGETAASNGATTRAK